MPQLNSDEAANDEPTTYNVEECEDDQRWHENLNDIKGDLVGDLDGDPRSSNNSKNHGHGESSNKDRMERDPRDEIKGPGRPNLFYPTDLGSIVSGLHPNMFNGGLPPNSKVPYPYSVPYHALLYGPSASSDLDSKTGMSRPHHPDVPSMYALPGNLGHVPHPLAPWPAAPIYPICTASTVAMASMLRYPNPFAAFTSSAAAAVAASNMPRFPLGPPHPHGPGIHPTMIPHPALVSNGPLSNMGNGQHPHHMKHDQDKPGRHSKSESEHGGRSKRDRPYVKKPLNAFMLYMKEQRAKVVAECTLKESAAINQILGRKWHSLSREEQQKYYEMARKERQLHLQLYPGWSARDNYGKRKKRKKEKSQGECTAQNPKKCRAVFGLEQQQLWCAPCRRKKKCIRYQHDDDSDDDDLSPVQSPQFQNFPNQSNPFDAGRSSSPLSITSQSTNVTNGNGDYGPITSSSSRLPGTQISPMQPGMIQSIKEEFRTSPIGMDGHQSMTNGGGNFDPYTNRHPRRAPSSDNSFKSEGSPNSQGGDSGIGQGHRRSNDNSNNNNGKELTSRRGEGDCSGRHVANGNPPQNTVHRQASAPSGGESRSNFRKTNSLDGIDVPGTSGLGGRGGGPLPHNTSGNSNVSADSPGSSSHRTHGNRHSLGSLNKMPGGTGNPSLPHPSPQHPPSTGLFLPPHSPSFNHPSPHSAAFMTPYSPYFPPGMLAAFGGTPPSPLSSLMFSSFKGISPSGMGGPNPGSSSHSQARMTPGAVVEGKS